MTKDDFQNGLNLAMTYLTVSEFEKVIIDTVHYKTGEWHIGIHQSPEVARKRKVTQLFGLLQEYVNQDYVNNEDGIRSLEEIEKLLNE